MTQRSIKAGCHLLLVVLAVAEWHIARTTLRKLLIGGCAGWHAAAAVLDWQDREPDNGMATEWLHLRSGRNEPHGT